MINITLLGTGGGMPLPNRFLSSSLISYQGRKILIDCGEGTQVAMRTLKTGFKAIDFILITHCHGDHIFGLPGLLSTIGNSEREEPITIIGPIGIRNIVNGLMLAIPNLPFEINIIENPRDTMEFLILNEIMEISFIELDHSIPCLGYSLYFHRKPRFLREKAELYNIPKNLWGKLQNGENVIYNNTEYTPDIILGPRRKGIKIIYITDTRPLDGIIEFINKSDLFICEGTYGDNDDLRKAIINKHMTFREAGKLASKGEVRELLLTHFSTSMEDPSLYIDNVMNIFPYTIIGYDGYNCTLNWIEDI